MLTSLHDLIVAEKDFLAGLAALATVFALFVPLPIYVFALVRERRSEARERAFALIDRLEGGEPAALRGRMLAIAARHDLAAPELEARLSEEERADLRRFMNDHERMGVLLNTARVDRRVFAAGWGAAYVFAWDRLAPVVAQLRTRLVPDLYAQWERAAERLRKRRP